MLNGALCLSDDSIWLRESLTDQKEIVYYSLTDLDQIPSIADRLLSNPDQMKEITRNGYRKASAYHTWACRAEVLEEMISQ
jgi:spore maturation protein CgeB